MRYIHNKSSGFAIVEFIVIGAVVAIAVTIAIVALYAIPENTSSEPTTANVQRNSSDKDASSYSAEDPSYSKVEDSYDRDAQRKSDSKLAATASVLYMTAEEKPLTEEYKDAFFEYLPKLERYKRGDIRLVPSSKANERPTGDKLYIYGGYRCKGSDIVKSETYAAAVLIKLEAGTIYCADR